MKHDAAVSMNAVFWLEQAQILGRTCRKPAQAPTNSAQHVQRAAAATTETAEGEKKASVQSPPAESVQEKPSDNNILTKVDLNMGSHPSSKEAVPAPGTPKLATPVKRPVSAELPRKAHAHEGLYLHHERLLAAPMCKATYGHTARSSMPVHVASIEALYGEINLWAGGNQ